MILSACIFDECKAWYKQQPLIYKGGLGGRGIDFVDINICASVGKGMR